MRLTPHLVAAALALIAASGPMVSAQAPTTPYLVLQWAEVEERIPPRSEPVIVFRLAVDAAAPCTADRAAVSYTFLLDTDRSRTTGTVTRAFPELGIDGSVEVRCDPATGRFTSEAGAVTVASRPGATPGWELAVAVPRRLAPSLEFDWVAIAREDHRYDRVPGSGASSLWRSVEWSW